ncbi:hypothetical protein BpHYR1_009324 [Brachionus plicatilis]|uniref:Uncharacterized protein n=1 Tax=Brachionus plicatilis TaxID=10195 RepID=A0A3M7T000_BRAPC|nr:hypothetical protein BpHYR1_009324 [Brachionus plicatilis]
MLVQLVSRLRQYYQCSSMPGLNDLTKASDQTTTKLGSVQDPVFISNFVLILGDKLKKNNDLKTKKSIKKQAQIYKKYQKLPQGFFGFLLKIQKKNC